MTTLTYDLTSEHAQAAPRRPGKRRALARPRPAAAASDVALSLPDVIAPAPRKRAMPLLLVAAIAALHGVVILSLSGGKRPNAPLQPVPVTITFAQPIVKPLPPPPPPPLKHELPQPPAPRLKVVKPVSAPIPVPPSTPVVANDTPLAAPSPDTMQVSRAPVAEAAPPLPPPPAPETVTEPRGYAGYLRNPAPDYPVAAQKRGLEGRVVLKVRVLASGQPDSVTVATSSGHAVLDDAAIKAVLQWVFAPARRGQTPIDGWVQVPLSFKL